MQQSNQNELDDYQRKYRDAKNENKNLKNQMDDKDREIMQLKITNEQLRVKSSG